MSKSRTSPVYLAAARDRILAELAAGVGYEKAAASAGVHPKALRRYALSNPTYAAKLEAAAAGRVYEPEGDRPEVIDVEVVGQPLMKPAPRPLPLGEPSLPGMTRAQFDAKVVEVLRDTGHPAWAKLAPLAFRYFHGAEMIQREAGVTEADQPPTRVLVIRVPVPETGADG